jgi:ATP-binding cassette subfamily B protein
MSEPCLSTSLRCLSAMLQHHGLIIREDELVRRFALGPEELDDSLILRVATDLGYKARRWRASFRKLERLGEAFPVLARLRNGRTVIVNGIFRPEDKEVGGRRSRAKPGLQVVVTDPMADRPGFLFVDRAEFEKAWDRTLIMLRPNTADDKDGRSFNIGWFVPEIMRQRSLLRDIAIAVMVLHMLALTVPIFFQLVVDRVLVHETMSTLVVLVVGVVLAILFDSAFGFLRSYLMLYATNRIDIRLARLTFAHLASLPIGFFERVPAGLLTKHMQQAEQIRQFLTGRVFFTLLDATALLVFLPVLWFYSAKLTLITLAFAGFIALVIAGLLVPYRQRLKALYDAEGQRQSMLVEAIHGMRTIKSLAIEPQQQRDWEEKSARAVRMHFRVGRIAAFASASTQGFQKLLMVAIVAVGASDVFTGTLTVGALIAFNMIAGRVIDPLVQLVSLVQDYQEAALSVRMLGTVMNEPGENRGEATRLRPPLDGSIEFDRVSFRYAGGGAPTLTDASFRIEPGMIVGVVGRSGSGKTTLTRLMQGLYTAEQGTVRMSGIDVREFDLAHLRQNIGVVLQDDFMFRASIRSNLSITRRDAAPEEIVEAARLAGAHEFIERLPQGYDTPLEEGASNLSGGQRQRLAIARALVRRPQVLILDEATSALDPESEAIVRRNLFSIAEGRTLVIVSHRLSLLQDADMILVLDRGSIVSTGTHQDLVHDCPIYRGFWQEQNRVAA